MYASSAFMLRVVVGELLALERVLDAPVHHVAEQRHLLQLESGTSDRSPGACSRRSGGTSRRRRRWCRSRRCGRGGRPPSRACRARPSRSPCRVGVCRPCRARAAIGQRAAGHVVLEGQAVDAQRDHLVARDARHRLRRCSSASGPSAGRPPAAPSRATASRRPHALDDHDLALVAGLDRARRPAVVRADATATGSCASAVSMPRSLDASDAAPSRRAEPSEHPSSLHLGSPSARRAQ